MTFDWRKAFAPDLASVVSDVCARLPPSRLEPAHPITQTGGRKWPAITARGHQVEIPYRIYNETLSPRVWAAASDAERAILACIYSRHHDGRIRQEILPELLGWHDACVAPFVVQLLGEYVVEIVVDIASALEAPRDADVAITATLREFARENPAFMALTTARASSYWAEYYRRDFLRPMEYPGLIALARIGA